MAGWSLWTVRKGMARFRIELPLQVHVIDPRFLRIGSQVVCIVLLSLDRDLGLLPLQLLNTSSQSLRVLVRVFLLDLEVGLQLLHPLIGGLKPLDRRFQLRPSLFLGRIGLELEAGELGLELSDLRFDPVGLLLFLELLLSLEVLFFLELRWLVVWFAVVG